MRTSGNVFTVRRWICRLPGLLFGTGYILVLVGIFVLTKEISYNVIAYRNVTLDQSVYYESIPDYDIYTRNPSRIQSFNLTLYPGNLCADKDLFLFIYVHTDPKHRKQRSLIRKTFANPANFPKVKLKVIFVVGLPPEGRFVQQALEEETNFHHDILQENFMDTYKNLSFKGIAALKYITYNCQHVPFVLKTDDDIFVNIFSLVTHLQRLPSYGDLAHKAILCFVWTRMGVIRDPTSKWYVSRKEWEADYYYHYCSGSAFILTPKAAAAMYNASHTSPFLWVDDFYLTGILASAGKVNLTSFNGVYKLHFDEFQQKYDSNIAVGMTYIFSHVHDFGGYRALWNRIVRAQPYGNALPYNET